MLMVGIVAAPGWAVIIETFTIQDSTTIDTNGEPETPVAMSGALASVHSDIVWGGYSDNGSNANGSVRTNGRYLIFGSNTVRSDTYAYALLSGIDLSGGTAQVVIRAEITQPNPDDNEESGSYFFGAKLMIKDALDVWYVLDAVITITGDDFSNYVVPLSGPWLTIDTPHTLDAMAGSDEGPFNTSTAVTAPDLSNVTGSGLVVTQRSRAPIGGNANRTVNIDYIIWQGDDTAYDVPPFVHAGADRQGNFLTSGFDILDLAAQGYVAIQGDNLEVTDDITADPDHEWIQVSKPVGAPDVVFVRKNSPHDPYPLAGIDELAIDPNAVCEFLGDWVIALVADDGFGGLAADYVNIVVSENAPPDVDGIGGNDDRTVYVTDGCTENILGPYSPGLQYSGATEPYGEIGNGLGFTANISDDGFPRDGTGAPFQGDLEMEWTVLEQPDGSTVTFWVTDGMGGARVYSYDSYTGDDGDDPNITFDTVGAYRLQLRAHDGELSSWPDGDDPNEYAEINVIDNQRPIVDAGPDFNVVTTRNDTATLEGTVSDDDYPKCPNNLITTWYVDDAPEGSTTPIFGDLHSPTSTVTFGSTDADEGVFKLRLEANDGHSENGVANDVVDILVSTRNYIKTVLRPTDDAYIRSFGGGNSNNYGARTNMRTRTRQEFNGGPIDWESNNTRVGLIQFDLSEIPGNPKHLAAKLSIASDNNWEASARRNMSHVTDLISKNQTYDTVVYAVTQGLGGSWREGNENNDPPAPSTGEAGTDLMLGITGANVDFTLTEIYRHEYNLGTPGTEIDINAGGTRFPSNTRIPGFPVDGMLFQGDDTVAFCIRLDSDVEDRVFFSKEATEGNDGFPSSFGGYGGPELTIYYDPNQPYSPKPGNQAKDISELGTQLAWKANGNATFDVYLSENKTLIENLTGGLVGTADWKGPTDPNVTFDLGAVIADLGRNKTYYWTVVGTGGDPVASDVWMFGTTEEPILTHPIGKDTMVTPGDLDEAFFAWSGASSSVTFDLYMHTDQSLVDSMNASALVATGLKSEDSPWDPNFTVIYTLANDNEAGNLIEYWRIVGHPPIGADLVSAVAMFSVDQQEKIEQFEETWADGFLNGLNNHEGNWKALGAGSLYWLHNDSATPPEMNNGTSAKLDYTGPAMAEFTFVVPRNWSTATNRYAFRTQYHGFPGNSDGDPNLVVTITDTSNNSHTEAYDTGIEGSFEFWEDSRTWNDWANDMVPLAPFAAAGVDLSSVASYALGVDGGDNTGVAGTFYFDGVQIFGKHCRAAEFDYVFSGGDCVVDVNEIIALAERWLMDSSTVVSAAGSEPTLGLILHWPFDNSLADASGRVPPVEPDYRLVVVGGNELYDTDVAPIPGGSNTHSFLAGSTSRIGLDVGNNSAEAAHTTAAFLPVTTSMTLSTWVKGVKITSPSGAGQSTNGRLARHRWFRLRKGAGGTDYQYEIPNRDGELRFRFDDADLPADTDDADYNQNLSWSEDDSGPADFEEVWHNWVMVYDGDNGQAFLYQDGVVVDWEGVYSTDIDTYPPIVGPMTRLRLLDSSGDGDNSLEGLLDEVRVYSRALSQPEVIWLAGKASVVQPVMGDGPDVNGDGKYNLADLAEISAEYGRIDIFWP